MTVSQRDALVAALVGRPEGLPAPLEVDLAAFWDKFGRTAPWHVRTGFRAATLVLAVAYPAARGRWRGLAGCTEVQATQLVERAAGGVLTGPLVEVAKVVATMAYFSDDRVESAVRSR